MSHLQVVISGQGRGINTGTSGVCILDLGAWVVLTGWAILFRRKGLGRRRLCVIFVPVQHRTFPGMGWELQTASNLSSSGTRA